MVFCLIGSPGRSLVIFTSHGVYNSTQLLLSNDENTLFVGARDTILSIDISQTNTMTIKEKVSVGYLFLLEITWLIFI